MNNIFLKSIQIQNFKGIANAEFTFNDKLNRIEGANGAGKSTVMYAFEWLLCQNVPDVLPHINKKEIPNLTTRVTATLSINGYDYILERSNKGKYKQDTQAKIGNESFYKIDDIDMRTEKEYKEKVVDLFGCKSFENLQLLIDKDYFNTDTTKFKWSDRRKILFEMCNVNEATKDLINQEKYNTIKEYKIKGFATSDVKSMLRKEKTGYKDQQVRNSILIEQKQKEIAELSSIDFANTEKELNSLKKKLNKILTSSKQEIATDEIKDLHNKILELNNEKTQLEMQDMSKQNALRKQVNDKFNALQDIKYKYNMQNSTNEIDTADICPVCHRKFTQKYIDERKKQEATHKEEIEELKQTYNSYKQEFETLKAQLDNFKPNERIKELEQAIVTAQNDLQSAKNEISNKLSNDEQKALETKIQELEREMAKQSFIEVAKKNIATWKEESKSLADKIVAVEKKETALDDYIKEQINLIETTVDNKFNNGISWALYKETYKNGEGGIEEDCICMYNGKDYSSLSMGERNKANIEIVKTLQDYYGVRLPLFIDNSETTTIDYNADTQIIELFVNKNSKLDNVTKIEDIYKGE